MFPLRLSPSFQFICIEMAKPLRLVRENGYLLNARFGEYGPPWPLAI